MAEPASPGVPARIWSRRWVRRLTYLLASGAALAGLAGFLATRPFVDAWLVERLNTFVKAETGLEFQADRLVIRPFQGRFILHRPALGGTLFQAERLELEVEWGSLLRLPHIRDVLLVKPLLNLSEASLAGLRLKAHPPAKEPLKILVSRILVQGGHVEVAEPAWGLPSGSYDFHIQGQGWTANQVFLDLQIPAMAVGKGKHRLQGSFALKAAVTDQRAELQRGQLRLGGNQLNFKGSYGYRPGTLEAQAQGSLELAQVLGLVAPDQPPALLGSVAFSGQVAGPLKGLHWQGALQGRELQAKAVTMAPGALEINASGRPGQLRLEQFKWFSRDGQVSGQGEWTPNGGTRVELAAERIALAAVATYTRTAFLKDLVAHFQGQATLPGAPWQQPRLDQVTFQGHGQVFNQDLQVGGMNLSVANSRVQLTDLALELPEAALHGKATAVLTRRGLGSLTAEGDLRTDAKDVARALQVWKIGDHGPDHTVAPFNMEGQTRASAQVSWTAAAGLQLTGHAEVLQARWHGARADRLTAEVSIAGERLQVSDIQLEKGEGRGYGEFMVTWAPLPPGAEALDMCYRVFRLPIHEGLKAADQGDLPIQGTGSGWVRLHGPLDHILMEGRAVAEDAEAYGFRLPAAASDFKLDLASMRLEALDTRVADTLANLAVASASPTGALALRGSMDMDIPRERWTVALEGQLDSHVLGLPGPQLQTWVDGRLDGDITTPFGPYPLPTGRVSFTRGRLSQDQHTLEGLEGNLNLREGQLSLEAGVTGMPERVVRLEAVQLGGQRLAGSLRLNLSQDSAETAKLAPQLTQEFLQDARLIYQAQGSWTPQGLAFKGILEQFSGQFQGFQLVQSRSGQIDGDTRGLDLKLALEGRPGLAGGSELGPSAPSTTNLGMEGRVAFSPSAPLNLQVAGSAEMANLKTILDLLVQPGQYSLLADMHPGGTARVDLNLGGTLQEVTLGGTLQVKAGRVSVRTYPQSIENVDFTARFQGREISIAEDNPLVGVLAQGAVKAWGQATWDLGGLTRYDLHANVEDFQLRDLPEGFELQGSLDANLSGNDQDGGLLKGSVWAKRMLYRADINLTDLILANASGSTKGLNTLDPMDPLARIGLDLDLYLGEPWEFDTNLLKLQGRPRGSFKVQGSLAQPGLKGQMELIPGGRFTNLLPAGDIVLERGTVVFKDPAIFNPNIDIQGRVDVPPYLVNLAITGTLDSLQATPTSTPSLRQADIFAILIDPDSAATVGSTAGFSSQAVVSTGLASTGTGLLSYLALANLQEGLRKTLNLDRVSVVFRSGVGAAETQVILGKSINVQGYRIPLVFRHRRSGETTTISGQVEWRFGDIILQVGASQSNGGSLNPSGEIRHTWTPK